ncbi:MAG: molybdenum cofactor biosynthesis protein MoaE [Chitinophagales bacterium]
MKKPKKFFVEGPISPDFIANSIAKHSIKTDIGAHQIFLGQVRADILDGQKVSAIEYSAYETMAENVFHDIRETTFARFDLSCMHIYHSLGEVKAGEICLFVFVSSKHRDECYKAIHELVEAIKVKVPIFGKEIFEDGAHTWKLNT